MVLAWGPMRWPSDITVLGVIPKASHMSGALTGNTQTAGARTAVVLKHLSMYQCGVTTRLLQRVSFEITRFLNMMTQSMSRPNYCKVPSAFMLCHTIGHRCPVCEVPATSGFQWEGEGIEGQCLMLEKQTPRGTRISISENLTTWPHLMARRLGAVLS